MPSDDRVDLALNVLAGQRDAFRTALGTTVEQVQAFLSEQRSSANGGVNRLAAEMGHDRAGQAQSRPLLRPRPAGR